MTKQRTSRGILLALLLVLVIGVSGCYPVAPDPNSGSCGRQRHSTD